MKKILYILLGSALIGGLGCKKEFLEVTSPSSLDEDFVFSSPSEAFKALAGEYEIWRGANGGLFYDIDVVGSDAEHHPETYDAQTRHIPEGLYASEISIDYSNSVGAWGNWYRVANRANLIMEAIGKKTEYQDAVTAGTPNAWSQLYGEAAVFRAFSYHQLIRYFGDVPYFTTSITSTEQTDSAKLVSRDIIYDSEIENLMKVIPLMYRIGEGSINAERFSRTFAEGLLSKMALFAGGYGLRRNDMDYGGVAFEQKGIEKWNAKYVRRSDYKKYYEIAKTYLQNIVDNPGTVRLITTDERGANFNNPFQRNFQYNMDLVTSPESLYEIGETQGQFSERPYAFGRPSGGGGSNAYPCKSYGQSRMYSTYYYGDFDPKDLRRDVTTNVTVNSGAASERLVDFSPGSRDKGGLPNNKWDETRMARPYTPSQRQSGVNWPMMRMAEVILMLAEVKAELADEAGAKAELLKVRSRAFSPADQMTKATDYVNALSGQSLKDAIWEEKKLEFAGEGILRYDYIRAGILTDKIKQVRDAQKAMVADLKSKGFHTFANGNQISNYIYVKAVSVTDYGMKDMLTFQTIVDESDAAYPVKSPGWRGTRSVWPVDGTTFPITDKRNLAIQGLFRYIDPNSAEAAALVAQGYVKTNWGANIVAYEDQYTTNIFKGYTDADYAAGTPPRYLFPLSSETVSKSNGLITNGYGFQ